VEGAQVGSVFLMPLAEGAQVVGKKVAFLIAPVEGAQVVCHTLGWKWVAFDAKR
jgi:hypothetical protein